MFALFYVLWMLIVLCAKATVAIVQLSWAMLVLSWAMLVLSWLAIAGTVKLIVAVMNAIRLRRKLAHA